MTFSSLSHSASSFVCSAIGVMQRVARVHLQQPILASLALLWRWGFLPLELLVWLVGRVE